MLLFLPLLSKETVLCSAKPRTLPCFFCWIATFHYWTLCIISSLSVVFDSKIFWFYWVCNCLLSLLKRIVSESSRTTRRQIRRPIAQPMVPIMCGRCAEKTWSFSWWISWGFTGNISWCLQLLVSHSVIHSSAHWFLHVIDFMAFLWHLNNHLLIQWCTSQPQSFIAFAFHRHSYRPIGHWSLTLSLPCFEACCPLPLVRPVWCLDVFENGASEPSNLDLWVQWAL